MADDVTLKDLLEEAALFTETWERNSPPEEWPLEVRLLVQLRQQTALLTKGAEEAHDLYDPYDEQGVDAVLMEERLRGLPTLYTVLPPLQATERTNES